MSVSTGLTADAPVRGHHTPEHLALGTHSVHFYDDDSYFLGSLTTLIATALVEGDSAVIIATQEHRDGLAKRLKGRGLDLKAAVKTGRYCALDAAETLSKFMVHGAPDSSTFQRLHGIFSLLPPARPHGELSTPISSSERWSPFFHRKETSKPQSNSNNSGTISRIHIPSTSIAPTR